MLLSRLIKKTMLCIWCESACSPDLATGNKDVSTPGSLEVQDLHSSGSLGSDLTSWLKNKNRKKKICLRSNADRPTSTHVFLIIS